MQESYDVIIVGSGLGGLVCAYILSKKGMKVAVLEKNAQLGGCLQTFTRKGIKFDTGMHYIGSMQENQILYRLFKFLHLLNDVPLQQLNADGYDVIAFGNQHFKYANGYDRYVDTLSQNFPENRKDLCKYVSQIQEIADSSPLYNLKKINPNFFIEASYFRTGIHEFISAITNNELLQNVLVGNAPLFAGMKDKTPLYTYALINNFYIQSAFRIIGGADSIATSLINSIRQFGGEVFANSEVDEIICDDTHATSVHLTNGQTFFADFFISNVHPQMTMKMVDSHLIRKAYRERIENLKNTISNFTIYLKFKENKVPYLNYNYYYYDKPNVWASNDCPKEEWPFNYLYMHQCTQRDPQYASSAEIIGYMHYEEVKKWQNTSVMHRGAEYEDFKEKHVELLLRKLEQSFPGIRQNIEDYWTSTPLTYQNYTYTSDGSMYGIVHDKNNPAQTRISERTKIPNLFLTGQNINSHGILGVTIGALITSAYIVGLPQILWEIFESEKK